MQTQINAIHNTVNNKWNTRDYITLAIFNVVMLVVLTLITTLTHALSYLIGGGFAALFNGPIYMVMSNKINKRGILFFSSIILGLFFLAFGFIHFLITMAVVGILCELIMWGNNTYKNTLRNAISYGIFYVGYSLCGVVPLVFFKEQYVAILEKSYSQDQLASLLYNYETPSLVVTMCFISVAGGFAGCFIGNLLLKKHVKKAKLV
ncbi:MptD family putative ECF transporter S component [Paenibacillus sp.]|jgi:energy-coupling factor transport system substrate-specific component|uniref:MptD family putative ECF transporter S component n=1 Tax=Paenibacillus sp. TaxID=58172 RepID=UPI002819271A|nr:MptD family putative ECF transporter S component [Paenibacillus sp.]MDR0270432.1 MptD family putative ECF transporter S component [Paenibacillus sp.]